MQSAFQITEVVSGGARGVDIVAIQYGRIYKVPVKIFKLDWGQFGKITGMVRVKVLSI